MSFDKKSSVKFASAVLTGALVLGGAYPVAAETPGNNLETEAAETEAKEKVVFLAIAEEKESHFAGDAVHSLEEALAQFGDQENQKEEGPAKFEPIQNVKKILVLCTGTEVSDEEKKLIEEEGISLMSEADYEAAQKAKEEAAKKEAEKEIEKEIEKEEVVETETVIDPVVEEADQQTTGSLIWEKPQSSADTQAKEEIPQISVKDEVAPQNPVKGETAPQTSVKEETAAGTSAAQTDANKADKEQTTLDITTDNRKEETETAEDEAESADQEVEKETEATEVVVYDLFAMFGVEETVVERTSAEEVVPAMLSAETADAEDVNPLVEKEETSDLTEETPSVMLLPGIDLVGNGTSGGSNKPASKPTTPSGSTTGSNTGSSTAAGNSSSGSGNSSASSAPATSAGASKPSSTAAAVTGTGTVKTGDASNRPFWGLSAGISAAMAAYFVAQWRRFRREEE